MLFKYFIFKLIFNILFFTFIYFHLAITLQANSKENSDEEFFQSLYV